MLGSFDILGWFNFITTAGTKDIIVSLPLFCQISGASISELDFEKYLIRLKINYLVKLLKEDEKKLTKRGEKIRSEFHLLLS